MDAFLNNPKLAQLSAKYPNLQARIMDVIELIDQELLKPQQSSTHQQWTATEGASSNRSSSSSSLRGASGDVPSGSGTSVAALAHIDWWVHVMDLVSRHGAIYSIIDAMELLISEDKIARLEGLSSAAITRVSGTHWGVTWDDFLSFLQHGLQLGQQFRNR
jgi:hypothetical protein